MIELREYTTWTIHTAEHWTLPESPLKTKNTSAVGRQNYKTGLNIASNLCLIAMFIKNERKQEHNVKILPPWMSTLDYREESFPKESVLFGERRTVPGSFFLSLFL